MTKPLIGTLGSSVCVSWPDQRVTLEYARIDEHRETVTAEVHILSEVTGEVHWSRFNLLAAQARANVTKACVETARDHTDWRGIVDRSCQMVVRHLRAGTPAVELVPRAPEPEWISNRWLVPGLIARRQINVLYGPGDTGKSWLALAIAVSGILGHALSSAWKVGEIERVMYLDWESEEADHAGRLWALTNGLEALPPGRVLYRRMRRQLADMVDEVSTEIAREKVDTVITDSLGAASGLEPESNEAALRVMGALRRIDATHIVLAHVSKSGLDQDGPRRIFGGIYHENTARVTIEARRREDTDGQLVIDLHQRKNNLGRRAQPSALALTWDDDGHARVAGAQVDLTAASLSTRLLDALRSGPETVAVLAETTGSSDLTVRSTLARLRNRGKVVQLTVSHGGRNKETQWGRVDENRGTHDA